MLAATDIASCADCVRLVPVLERRARHHVLGRAARLSRPVDELGRGVLERVHVATEPARDRVRAHGRAVLVL